MTSADFNNASFPIEWLIKGILVKDQFTVVGGPRKSLKTSALVDLVVSLGASPSNAGANGTFFKSGTLPRFFGHFPVEKSRRIGFFSGESGGATLQETARRVCSTRGINLDTTTIHWCASVPRLSDAADLDKLRSEIRNNGLEVVVVDPFYLALGAGRTRVDVSSMFHVGPVLAEFSQACLEEGATPILVAHTRKYREPGDRNEPLELEELAFAGIQEFARQWILISRRERFVPGTGCHRLWLNVGGSAGHSSVWAVEINEGAMGDNFGGRTWDVRVMSREQVKQADQTAKEHKKSVAKAAKEDVLRKAVARHLGKPENRNGDSATGIAQGVGVSRSRYLQPVFSSMLKVGELLAVDRLQKGNRICSGYRLPDAPNNQD
jgi:hypothetical protein